MHRASAGKRKLYSVRTRTKLNKRKQTEKCSPLHAGLCSILVLSKTGDTVDAEKADWSPTGNALHYQNHRSHAQLRTCDLTGQRKPESRARAGGATSPEGWHSCLNRRRFLSINTISPDPDERGADGRQKLEWRQTDRCRREHLRRLIGRSIDKR
jgi:hypothetical protein